MCGLLYRSDTRRFSVRSLTHLWRRLSDPSASSMRPPATSRTRFRCASALVVFVETVPKYRRRIANNHFLWADAFVVSVHFHKFWRKLKNALHMGWRFWGVWIVFPCMLMQSPFSWKWWVWCLALCAMRFWTAQRWRCAPARSRSSSKISNYTGALEVSPPPCSI